MAEEATQEGQEGQAENGTGETQGEEPSENGTGEQDGLMDPDAGTDDGSEETQTYEPSGELTQEQIESLPDDAINDDGTVDAEQIVKQNLGFRKKMSDGELEEAIEFYEEHGGEIDEDGDDNTETDETEDAVDIPDSPEEYDIQLEGEDGEKQVDDDLLPILQEAAYESEMTPEQVNEFVNNFEANFTENFSRSIDPDEELSKISDDPQEAQKVVKEVETKIDQWHDRGFLNEAEYRELKLAGGTAEGVSAIRKLMTKMDGATDDIPTDTPSVGGETLADINQQLSELMDKDAYYQSDHPEHEKVHKEANELRQKKIELEE